MPYMTDVGSDQTWDEVIDRSLRLVYVIAVWLVRVVSSHVGEFILKTQIRLPETK